MAPTIMTHIFIITCLNPTIDSSFIIIPARNSGNTQYPSTDTLWKKEILPPRVRVLKVTTRAPPKQAAKINRNSVASTLATSYC